MFEKILVGVDGSAHSAAALNAARELASLSGGEVRVLNVREVSLSRAGVMAAETPAEASEVVEEAVQKLTSDGVIATGAVRASVAGHVAAEILVEAKEFGATVIVLATRGLSDLAGLMVGSTTHKVLHLGRIPVLVVK